MRKYNQADTTTAQQWTDAAGNVILNIDQSNQRIGIGTNAPAVTLDINGSLTAVGTVTFNDASNATCALIDNDGTGMGAQITQDGVLASSSVHGLYVYSNVAQVTPNAHLLKVYDDHASSTHETVSFENDGTGKLLRLLQNGVLGSSKYAIQCYSNVAQVNSPLTIFHLDHASSDQALIKLTQDGSGVQIAGTGDENLSNVGVWTNRSSTFSEKDIIGIADTSDYIDKLKNLKLYEYQKKAEVYGNKTEVLSNTPIDYEEEDIEEAEDIANNKPLKLRYRKEKNGKEYIVKGKKYYEVIGTDFPKQKKNPNSRKYKGYVLDDTSTPGELIARNNETGEIAGVSPADGVDFLLGVCKELVKRIEVLENQ
jgi:hypothetical protein